MGDSLNPDDFLAAALRQSRSAVADEGFSRRVQQRVLVVRRRQKFAYAVRVVCALSTLFLAGAIFGYVCTKAGVFLAQFMSFVATTQHSTALDSLAHLGLPPWMLALGLGALIVTVALREADRDPPLRF